MSVSVALGALVAGAGTFAATEAPAAADGDQGALYLAVSGVLVALITSGFALLKDRAPRPDPSRHLPEAADALDAEMTRVNTLREDLRHERAEINRLRSEVDLWQQRAYSQGWRP